MKTGLSRSFYIIRGIMYFFLLLSVVGGVFQVFGLLIPAIYGGRPPALRYHTEKIDLSLYPKKGDDILVLENFRFDPLIKQEGNITLHSGSGKSYKAYYSPVFEKLRVNIAEDFAGKLQMIIRILYLLNLALMFATLYIIVNILTSLEEGSPFTIRNAKYIRATGSITILSLFIGFVVNRMVESYIESELSLVFKSVFIPNVVNVLLFALILLILAYVIKQGVRMKEEQDLTI